MVHVNADLYYDKREISYLAEELIKLKTKTEDVNAAVILDEAADILQELVREIG